MANADDISAHVVNEALRLHRSLGPGLLESVYKMVLAARLERLGLKVDRQRPVDIDFDGLHFAAAFKMDLLIENCVIVEIKSVEQLNRAHAKQFLTYLRLTGCTLGLLLNFGAATMKEGTRRIVNDHNPFASSRLRVNHSKGDQ